MKRKLLFLACFCTIQFAFLSNQAKAQVAVQDSLALVDLYIATNGDDWENNENWLVGNVADWFGITVVEKRVTRITLPSNQLSCERLEGLPESFGELTALVDIDLSNNRQFSTALPSSFFELNTLKRINLSWCLITGEIPASFGHRRIELLDLNGNRFSGGIDFLRNFDLENCHVNLLSNSFSGTLEPLANFSTITNTNLSGNDLSGSLSELTNLRNVDSVDLSRNNLSGSLNKLSELEMISNFNLRLNEFTSLPDLSNFSSITNLDISNNNLSFEGIATLLSNRQIRVFPQRRIQLLLNNDRSVYLRRGESVTLTVPPKAGEDVEIIWIKDDVELPDVNGRKLTIEGSIETEGAYRAVYSSVHTPGFILQTEKIFIELGKFNRDFKKVDPEHSINLFDLKNENINNEAAMSKNLGDLNNDQIDDFGILSSNQLLIYYGGDYKTTPDITIEPDNGHAFGILRAADLNGDGFKDILLSQLDIESKTYSFSSLKVYYGAVEFDVQVDHQIDVDDLKEANLIDINTTFGLRRNANIQTIGDVNHDGYQDFMIFINGTNIVNLYFGGETLSKAPDLILEDFDVTKDRSSFASGPFSEGIRSHALGDINQDGIDDFAIVDLGRKPTPSTGGTLSGFINIYFGNETGEFESPDQQITAPADFMISSSSIDFFSFGYNMAASDYNKDGLVDLLIMPRSLLAFNSVMEEIKDVIYIYYNNGGEFDSVPDHRLRIPSAPFSGKFSPFVTTFSTQLITIPSMDNDDADELILASTGGESTNAVLVNSGDGYLNEEDIPSMVFKAPLKGGLGAGSEESWREPSAAIGDFDADGVMEVILVEGGSLFHVYPLQKIVEVIEDNQINIYPNPASDSFVIAVQDIDPSQLKAQLFDMEGRRLLVPIEVINDQLYVDINQLQNGIYILALQICDQRFSRRIVKG